LSVLSFNSCTSFKFIDFAFFFKWSLQEHKSRLHYIHSQQGGGKLFQNINLYGTISPRRLESSPTSLQALQDVMSGKSLHDFIAQ